MHFSRRTLIGAGLAAGTLPLFSGCESAPGAASADLAQSSMPAWQLGYSNAPADGFGPSPMRLVFGKAPADLTGTLYRNGPGQFTYGDETLGHWFDGDGMIQRIRIEGGQAVHTGRFVQTRKRRDEQDAGKFLAVGFGSVGDPDYPLSGPDDANAANTSVVMSDGELLALWEGGSAFRMDPETLETRGPKTWRNDLKGMPFLAHPKREPDGRLWNLGVGGTNVGIFRIGANGALEDFGMVDMGTPAYVHDWAMTERHLVILVQPWIYTRNLPPFVDHVEWMPEEGMKILIVDKDDFENQRWAQAPARSFYHTGAAWEDADGTIRIDAALYKKPILGSGGGTSEMRGVYRDEDAFHSDLSQIVVPLKGDARLIETGVDGEFPQVDHRLHGQPRRLTALVTGAVSGRPGASAVSVHDWESGATKTFDLGPARLVEEHLFVAKPGGTREEDCWLVGTALNTETKATEIWIFDVAGVDDGPVAVFSADYAWPLGFHGTWAA